MLTFLLLVLENQMKSHQWFLTICYYFYALKCYTHFISFNFSEHLDVGPNQDLVNVDEKIQRASLKAYYEK